MVVSSVLTDQVVLDHLETERKKYESDYPNILTATPSGTLESLFQDLPEGKNVPSPSMRSSKKFIIDGHRYQDNANIDKLADYLGAAYVSNSVLYLPNTNLKWHTNSNAPGKRLYFCYLYNGESSFRYLDNTTNTIVDDIEPVGTWIQREFTIAEDELFWHTVATTGCRLSYGFFIQD